jgi:RNA recognition motif-containing protein
MRLYVGNLSFNTTEEDLREVLEKHGAVHEIKLVTDRETGRPRGFGFVEMDDAAGAAAIRAIDGMELGGRNLKVSEAQPRGEGGGGRQRSRW